MQRENKVWKCPFCKWATFQQIASYISGEEPTHPQFACHPMMENNCRTHHSPFFPGSNLVAKSMPIGGRPLKILLRLYLKDSFLFLWRVYLRPYYKLIFGMAEIADLFIDFLLKDLHFWQISLNTVAVVVGSRLVSFIGRVNRKSEIRNQHSII